MFLRLGGVTGEEESFNIGRLICALLKQASTKPVELHVRQRPEKLGIRILCHSAFEYQDSNLLGSA